MAKILCLIMAVSLYILTGCNKHLCDVNKGIDYPPKELDSLFGNDIHFYTGNYKGLIMNENELSDNSFQIVKYLTWYRMPGASKLFLFKRKNLFKACYSLFQSKPTCDSIPSKNGAYNTEDNNKKYE